MQFIIVPNYSKQRVFPCIIQTSDRNPQFPSCQTVSNKLNSKIKRINDATRSSLQLTGYELYGIGQLLSFDTTRNWYILNNSLGSTHMDTWEAAFFFHELCGKSHGQRLARNFWCFSLRFLTYFQSDF